jgi:citrate lyase subunit beta/citryl-CoA lyase
MRQLFREAAQYRSMLFVPGHKTDWLMKASRYGADALLFDLEDSVPIDEKAEARAAVAKAIDAHAGSPFGRFVRINGWGTGHTLLDALAVVRDGLDGLMLTKVEDAEHVTALDLLLTDLEIDRGLPAGGIEILPRPETALGIYRNFEICECSARVRRYTGPGDALIPGGDATSALRLLLTPDDAPEWLVVNGAAGLQARAAGVTQVLGGMTNAISDLDLVRRLALRARALGATGSTSIHPSHVAIHNQVFSPS